MSELVSYHMARRLRARYARTDDATRRSGRAWYPAARAIARELADATDTDARTVAAIIAVLSPRIQWGQNISAARAVLRGDLAEARRYALGRNVEKAAAILARPDLADELTTGPKVRAFWRAICDDRAAVTVDVWAARAAGAADAGLTPPRVQRIAHAYELAARHCDETPRDLQAILWLHERGTKPTDLRLETA